MLMAFPMQTPHELTVVMHVILLPMEALVIHSRLSVGEQIFRAGMYWRIIYGGIRIILASFLLNFVGTPAADAYHQVLKRLFIDDSDDHIFGFISQTLSEHGFAITYFVIAYFFFWGAVDIFLSLAMLRHLLWAFPLSLVLITAFILYEIYRYSHTHSDVLLVIIAVDVFLIYLIRQEYHKLRRKIHLASDCLPE